MPFIRRLPPGSTFFLVDEHPTQKNAPQRLNDEPPPTKTALGPKKSDVILLLRYITHAYSRGMLTGIYEGMLTTLEKGRCCANHVCMHRQSMPFRDGRILHPSQACRPRNWLAERQYHRAQRGYSALSPHPADPMVIDLLKNDGIDANSHSSTPLTTDISRQADLILCFEREQISDLLEQNPLAIRKVFLFNDFVNACKHMHAEGPIAGDTAADKLIEIMDCVPMLRPFFAYGTRNRRPSSSITRGV